MAGYNIPAILLPTVDWNKFYPDKVLTCFEQIEADYGLKGFAIVIKLWQYVCGSSEGYYTKWDDRVGSLFAYKIHASKGLVWEILNVLLKEDFFSRKMYDKYGILTAGWIQENWLNYMSRRKNAKVRNEYLLVNCAQNSEDVNNSGKIADKNTKNADKNNTTKLNITKHNLSYLNDKDSEPDGSASSPSTKKPARHKYGEYKHVMLTDEQYSKLIADFGEVKTTDYIRQCDEYCEQHGKHYSNYNLTIRKWIKRDEEKGGRSVSSKQRHDNTAASYDLDEWEKFALSYDPNKKGGT